MFHKYSQRSLAANPMNESDDNVVDFKYGIFCTKHSEWYNIF